MDDLMQMKQSFIGTIQHPPRLLRGVLCGICAALSLIFLREFVYWVAFTVQFANLSHMIGENIANTFAYGILTVIMAVLTWRAWPRGGLTAPITIPDDDGPAANDAGTVR